MPPTPCRNLDIIPRRIINLSQALYNQPHFADHLPLSDILSYFRQIQYYLEQRYWRAPLCDQDQFFERSGGINISRRYLILQRLFDQLLSKVGASVQNQVIQHYCPIA